MSNNTMIEVLEDPVNLKDEAKIPGKINAFQFMMSSRHNIIGSNVSGKEKKDDELKPPEMTEKTKAKISKRKAVFEDWAEKKGGTKRKLLDEAAGKHINKTLHKRAKRLKKMLDIIDEELKNSGEEGSENEDVFLKVKTKKRRAPLRIDSDDSNSAEGINGTELGKLEKDCENVQENGNNENKDNKTTLKKESKINNIEFERTQVKDTSFKEDVKENIVNNAEVLEEQIKKTSKEEIDLKLAEINEKENINNGKENNNKSPEINITKKGKNSRNSDKKNIRKRSLSLRKSKYAVEDTSTSQVNKSDKSEDNGELTDEEIFPKNLNESKKTHQLKFTNDSTQNTKKNEDFKNECFSPRAWRMKLKVVPNEENERKLENNEPDCENYENKQLEIEESEKENDEECKKSEDLIASPQKQVTGDEVANSGSELKKQVKLAPIFLKQQSKQVDKNVLNAKKNFLRSGMPSKVMKLITKSKSFQEPEYTVNIFPKISHIQQRTADELINTFWDLPKTSLHLIETDVNTKQLFDKINIGSFTDCKSVDMNLNTDSHHASPLKYQNLKELVKEIKNQHPSYPVYKTFRLLYQKYEKHIYKLETKIQEIPKIETPKPKRGRPKKKKQIIVEESELKLDQVSEPTRLEMLMWTEKYRPQSQEDIIGNTTAVQELKFWLESWIKYSEDKKYSRKRRLSDSSDDFCSDNTKDSDNLPQNLMLLSGPLGCGKTSSVYGLCNELSINIIEINASSKRTGKKILADLQEATQSHQVKNTDSKSVNSFFQKKSDSQNEDDVNKKLSLLFFEDVDIVFEDQDDNFISAVATLAISSKRPIILTFTDKKCPHLQKFILQYSVITFSSLSGRILGPWLQILSLIEGVKADKDMIDKLVQWNKGDVRKIVLQLQFWTQTGGDGNDLIENINSSNSDKGAVDEEICVDDENPDVLWMNTEENSDTRNKNSNSCHQNCAESFIPYYERDKDGFKLSYPVNLDVLWWNIPVILGQNTNNFLIKADKEEKVLGTCETDSTNKRSLEELNTTVTFLESLVFTDVVHTRLKTECYNEPIYNYWQINPVNSLSLNQNFNMYKENNNTSLEFAHWMVENSAKRCQKFHENEHIKLGLNTTIPHFEEVSWRTKRHKCMKELLNAVPLITILDRRAICEDYQTILRSIIRIENERSIAKSKRKNRFYHYLKNFNIHMNDSTYLLLCNTLAANRID